MHFAVKDCVTFGQIDIAHNPPGDVVQAGNCRAESERFITQELNPLRFAWTATFQA
jgi:hypothetical protein